MIELTRWLQEKRELEAEQVQLAARSLLDVGIDDGQKEAFLEALSEKEATAREIADFVTQFLSFAVDPELISEEFAGPRMDVCGTGGDQLNLFNISTTSMFITAAAGAQVVKHGNRGITSKSGGADVLEALGVRIDLPPAGFRHCVAEAGLGFLFAPNYHPAFKAVTKVRQNLGARGIKTIFNLIGPLLNPARPTHQLVGVYRADLSDTFAKILQHLGREKAWVVHGRTADGCGVDEFSLMGETDVLMVEKGSEAVEKHILTPESLGLSRIGVESLQGGDAQENAVILRAILSGKELGPKRDMVLLNAAAAITCAGLAVEMQQALLIAKEKLADGSALDCLERLIKSSQA